MRSSLVSLKLRLKAIQPAVDHYFRSVYTLYLSMRCTLKHGCLKAKLKILAISLLPYNNMRRYIRLYSKSLLFWDAVSKELVGPWTKIVFYPFKFITQSIVKNCKTPCGQFVTCTFTTTHKANTRSYFREWATGWQPQAVVITYLIFDSNKVLGLG